MPVFQGMVALTTLLAVTPALAQAGGFDDRFSLMGFAELDYREADSGGPSGFIIGQAVGHMNARIDERLHLFTEMTATARRGRDFEFEIERLSLHYDFSDQFRFSAGRYHTPLGFWNAAYHHGSWLQTSVGRPRTVRFGSNVVPIHFVGALVEGRIAKSDFSYRAGIGNGRSDEINQPGDFGDVNTNRAWFASAQYEPLSRHRLDTGLSIYVDKASPAGQPAVDETLFSAYLALQSETPELVVEYHYGDHERSNGTGPSGNVSGFYAQFAYRLGGNAIAFKPYLRIETLDVDASDPLLGFIEPDYDGVIGGLRWDFSRYGALKAEVRNEEFDDAGKQTSIWLQLAVVLDGSQPSGGRMPMAMNGTKIARAGL